MMIPPGYELIEEISRNDFITLYRGRHQPDKKPVWLKIPHSGFPFHVEKDRLARESAILEKLTIKGVPRVLEFDQDNYLILEDGGGNTLRTFYESKRLNLESFFKLAIESAAVLSEIHRRGIVLHTINPDNVLYNPETGEVCFTDFYFAARNNAETQTMELPHWSNYALRYVSPEQTGRMNRTIDYRTDFYSLGITFYELLTGRLPFSSDDTLELIHSHIAKTPLPPAEIKPAIPGMLSDIVMKLIAKTAEQRYQSALGLKADLEICAEEWAKNRRITPFTLGRQDISDRFNIPQTLYGRETEIKQLLACFDSVCDGASVLMLVSGYSGIGKTSLIQELYRPIVQRRGYFITGKFDQVARGNPFGALIQAFREFVRQILTESEEQLNDWRTKLTGILGTNGGVLAEVVPEIELIIGKQPPPPALGAAETLNRFQLVFQNFVGAIARKKHPLVVFLDDLQWADSATLSLLQPLLAGSGVQHFLLIGTYRDNEVDAAHPLIRTLKALESAGIELNRLELKTLQLSDLTSFMSDTLHCKPAEVEPLVHLIWEKTGGNPFFVKQFLKTLKQEGFFVFDYANKRWTFQIEEITGAGVTDNVIDLMTRKIRRLTAKAQNALTLASCIGNPFDEQTLAAISGQSPEAVADDLEEAVHEGLILPSIHQYKFAAGQVAETSAAANSLFSFLHDRIQQAAYALIPEERKQVLHLTVGRLMHSLMEREPGEEKIFDVANHLNLAKDLITDEAELLKLARLNLKAGRKAKASAAFEMALDYLKTGSGLLTEKHWETDYELTFDLHLETAECQYLGGNFDEVEKQFESLLNRAGSKLDKARVFNLRMLQYENMARYTEAISIARESLVLFDVSLPDSEAEKQTALEREIETIQTLIGRRSIESLIELPVMNDAETQMVMNILTDIWSSLYITGDAVLARLVSAMMVRLSLIHGNTAESAYGYVTHAITVGPVRQNYKSAYEFGKLALKVNERFDDLRRRAKIHQQFHAHVALWRKPFEVCVEHARTACCSGLEAGDFLYAAYGAYTETWSAFLIARDLEKFVRDYRPNLSLIRKLKVSSFADAHNLMLHWAKALQGRTDALLSFSSAEFSENEYLETYRDNPFFTMFHSAAKMQLYYLFGEHEKALEAAQTAQNLVRHLSGTIWTAFFDFWNGLIYCDLGFEIADFGLAENVTKNPKTQIPNPKSLALLAENCPENYLCWSLLLTAEIERVKGREVAALELYEKAIIYADEIGSLQNQALAHELYAKFWRRRGQEKIAALLLSAACRYYADWGASAKVKHLQQNYAELLESQIKPPFPKTSETTAADKFDLFSVTKAAQAITGEIEFEKLLAKLMSIVIENAGAERGSLILEREGGLFILAEGSLEETRVLTQTAIPLSEAQNLPLSVVNFTRRTLESVVLTNAEKDKRYGNDAYILRGRPISIMCVPVIRQGRLKGLLYLENNVMSGAFTPERIKVCQILASQAAISLENVQLYEEMKEEVAQRRQAEETLRSIMEGTAAVTGDNFFALLVQHLAAACQVRYAFITECREQIKTKTRTLAFWADERLAENVTYEIAETPCLNVLAGETCFYSKDVQKLFPNDRDLVEMNAEGYLGIPLLNSSKQVIGHLAVLNDKPITQTSQGMSLLNIFAARAGAELERLHAENELRLAMEEVKRLKNQLHAENIYLQEEIRQQHNFEEIIGDSPALLEALQKIERVAPTDASVLITGETGTGKELFARAIHNLSRRKNRPLVKVNCGAISAGLVESELFGHVKGAFTGAVDRRVGRFELANGGTIFLDEVGELPPETQVKLLRVLQEGEFEPVGSSKTVKTDVRVIAATNRDLEEEIKSGKFRADLYYRLNVFPVHTPALRERREDIPLLVMFFLQGFVKKFGKQIRQVPAEVMKQLIDYDWMGNVRELQNIIERAVVLASPDETALYIELLPMLQPQTEKPEILAPYALSPNAVGSSFKPSVSTLEDVERQHILAVLEEAKWKIEGGKGAAEILNLHPNTLRSRMKKLGIKRP